MAKLHPYPCWACRHSLGKGFHLGRPPTILYAQKQPTGNRPDRRAASCPFQGTFCNYSSALLPAGEGSRSQSNVPDPAPWSEAPPVWPSAP